MSSTTEQRHRQPSEAAAGHPTVWSVDSCWRCKTLFDVCHTDTCHKTPLFVAGCAVTLVSPEMVYLCPVSSWQFESWLSDSRVIHKGRVDHWGRLPIILPLTGDVYRMSVCIDGSAWLKTITGRRKHLAVAAWRSGNGVGRINKVTLRRARLVLGWVTFPGSTPGGGTISVCNQPPRSTQPFILSRTINWVVSCNRMFASSHWRRHLVNAYGVKAWCGWLGRWCVL